MSRAAILWIAPLLAWTQAGCCVFPLFPRVGCCGTRATGVPVGFTGPIGEPVGYGPGPDCVNCAKPGLIGSPVVLAPGSAPVPPPQLISSTGPTMAYPTGIPAPAAGPVFNGPPQIIAPPASTPLPAPMNSK